MSATDGGSGTSLLLDSPIDRAAPASVVDRDPKRFASLFGRWSNRSPPVVKLPPIEGHSDSSLTTTHPASATLEPLPSPRRPRHVPIVIPDYVSPYGPPQQVSALSVSPSPTLPTLPPPRTISADATKPDTDTSKSREKEVSRSYSKTTMNNSQVSLSASESGAESTTSSIHHSHSQTNLASPTNQQNAGPVSLSGLVWDVHRTTGQEPHALVGATTTILGDKLYVFGGRIHSKTKPQLTANLYELDLIRRHWVKLEPTGEVPSPRYFHSVCALGDTKLVCYGGMSPATRPRSPSTGASESQLEVVVVSDIHVYDVPTNTWTLIPPSRSDSPQGRYAHCATILPSSAVFASADSHTSAIHHNPSSTDPHSGTLGVQIDGTGGAEMVVVGGQDSNNNYIQQISVFNLRSLKWTSNTLFDRNCGAYKSMVAALPGINPQKIGRDEDLKQDANQDAGTSMLIYSNYNFLDVRLELQVRAPDGTLEEKVMAGPVSPPGLRFPNGGVINDHFVVSGTYLTSSKHEYALWALDLKTLTWAMIDTAGTVFGQGSWNRGILWNRRNAYVILGHRKRNLVDDYNHRRINFAHMCLVELEGYGLYDNPRKNSPSSAYVSNSAPAIPASLQQNLPSKTAGGRQISAVAARLGQNALDMAELCDMEIISQDGERIMCNSSILARRWGPFFSQLVLDSVSSDNGTGADAVSIRPTMMSRASRASALTITPSMNGITSAERSQSRLMNHIPVDPADCSAVPAGSRGRVLYLPHMAQTIRLMLHYLYTSGLPPLGDPLCSGHTLCSLLQMARPYQIDGLQEATIERLHEVLDGRNAAAVFNAAAMAAGGGRATGSGSIGTLEALERSESAATTVAGEGRPTSVLANNYSARRVHRRTDSGDSTSTATSATTSTTFSHTDTESPVIEQDPRRPTRPMWGGEKSSVIGLQKRGLRGLMEGRRQRERAVAGTGTSAGGGTGTD